MPKVVVSIVTWNSMKFLPDMLASLKTQTCEDAALIIVDNASTDGVIDFVRAHHPEAVVIRNPKNLGFAHGHNQAIAYARAHLRTEGDELYMLVTNPDVILTPNYIDTIVGRMEERRDAGSAGGKLLKMYQTGEDVLTEQVRSDIIDSTGIRITRSRRGVERGAGETDDASQYGRTEEVFGVSGALAMYRLSALEDIAYRGEFFDEDFFAYKEDIDIAWRLRLRGWAALYVPFAKAYHYRTAYGRERTGIIESIRRRRIRSAAVNFYSHRNHLLLLMKNDTIVNTMLHAPFILWYEFRKFLYVLFFEPRTLRAIAAAFFLMPRMLSKRRAVMSRATVRSADIRRWFR